MKQLRTTLTACLLAATLGTCAQVSAQVPAPRDTPYLGPIQIEVDATDLARHIFQVRQTLPVRPGRLTLLYPRYLPGNHGPSGAIERLAGLTVQAGGKRIAWTRDTVNPYAFHVEVPQGVSEIALSFQFLSPVGPDSGGRVVMTPEMLNLQWIAMVLYPAGHHASAVQMQASVKLPEGWTQASALRVSKQAGSSLAFQPVSLETLADSPLFAGAHVRRIELDAGPRPVTLTVFADTPEDLQASEAQIAAHRQLVTQADKLYGSRHFEHYDLLLATTDRMSGIGLEHHQSSENAVKSGYFKDWGKARGRRALLPHEYTHSWNGKFRRPADLWVPEYNVPMQDSLLWVYEGQTQYWGEVLSVRSGLVTPEQQRANWAEIAASYSHRTGRLWRNLQDTTNEAQLARGQPKTDWRNWQRGADYYPEAALVWLDADTLIREKSGGKKSLDDFARNFFGVEDGRVKPLTYTFDDLVAALNAVLPHDWRSFLRERLDGHAGAPLDGLKRAGWELTWATTPGEFASADSEAGRNNDLSYSLGLSIKADGRIDNVMWGGPAFDAGLTNAISIVAVNGRAYQRERLNAAITANKGGQAPLQLIVKEGDYFRSLTIDYRGGLRYPRLTRIEGTPDRLDALLAPLK